MSKVRLPTLQQWVEVVTGTEDELGTLDLS